MSTYSFSTEEGKVAHLIASKLGYCTKSGTPVEHHSGMAAYLGSYFVIGKNSTPDGDGGVEEGVAVVKEIINLTSRTTQNS